MRRGNSEASSPRTPDSDGRDPGVDCIVVGGGPAGLAAALDLSQDGMTVQVLEAAETAGGRVRSGFFEGEPADIGFQTVLRGYPSVKDLIERIGLDGSELHTFERRVVVHDGEKWRRLKLVGPGGLVTSGLLSRRDIGRIMRMAGRAGIGGVRELESGHHQTAAEFFASSGISREAVRLVLRPLLGSMLLDPTLESDAGYVRFLLAMLARGPAVLPVDGIGMIIDRAEAAVAQAGGMVFTRAPVERVVLGEDGRARGVELRDGRLVHAACVILAVGAREARRLLTGVDDVAAARVPSAPAGCVSATFALDTPLYSAATVLLNAAGPDETDRVDLVCQTTNVTRPGSPGPHILAVQSATAGWHDVDPGRYADRAVDQLRRMIPQYPWRENARLIAATDHPEALYRVTPGVRQNLPGPRTAVRNLILAGDITTHPSLEGAVSSGFRAASVAARMIP